MQQLAVVVVVSVLGLTSAQRTPTISYVTPNISTTRSIDCRYLQYIYHIYTISTQELDHRHGLLCAVGDGVPDPLDEDRQ